MEFFYDDVTINPEYYAVNHDMSTPTWAGEAGARFEESWRYAPSSAIGRSIELGVADVTESPTLTEEEWKKSDYFRPGLEFKDGVKENVAKIIADRKDEERQRQDIMSRSPKGILRAGSMFAVDFAAQLVDPLNLASAYVPIVSAAKFAGMGSKYGITAARAMTGAVEGLVGAAMVEPFVLGAAQQEQSDYTMMDSLMAVGFGAGFGSVVHVGAGTIGDFLGITKHAQGKAFEKALIGIIEGETADVAGILRAGDSDGGTFRARGPRHQFAADIAKMATLNIDQANAMFGLLDSISKSAWKRGLITDVDSLYDALLKEQARKVAGEPTTKRSFPDKEPFGPVSDLVKAFEKGDIKEVIKSLGAQIIHILNNNDSASMDVMFKSIGIEGRDRGMARLDARGEEAILRLFEKYMLEGKAPTAELAQTFENIKGWMLSMYEHVGDEYFTRTDWNNAEVSEATKEWFNAQKEYNKARTEQVRLLEEKRRLRQEAEDRAQWLDEGPDPNDPYWKENADAVAAIDERLRATTEELKPFAKNLDEKVRARAEAKAKATKPIEMTPEVKKIFDDFLRNDNAPKREKVLNKEEVKPKEKVDQPAEDFAKEAEAEVKVDDAELFKNMDEQIDVLRADLERAYQLGEMTEAQYRSVIDFMDAETKNLERRTELARSVASCVVGV